MPELIKIVVETATAFPTVIFTVLLGLVLLYWVISMLSGGGTEGAIEGMTEGLFEGLTEGAVDSLADGLADGLADSMADGALEGIGDAADGLADSGGSTLGRFLGCLGITAVPVTLFLSILIVISWGLSILVSRLVGVHIGVATTSLAVGSIVALTAFGLAVALTAWVIRPLKPLFRGDKMVSRSDLIGKVCTLTTMTVDDHFGMAEFNDGQAGLLLQVRCPHNNSFERGSFVRITNFDKENDIFSISPHAVEQGEVAKNQGRV